MATKKHEVEETVVNETAAAPATPTVSEVLDSMKGKPTLPPEQLPPVAQPPGDDMPFQFEGFGLTEEELAAQAAAAEAAKVSPAVANSALTGVNETSMAGTNSLADLASAGPSIEDLNKLDETDPTRAAAIRSQRNWENDAKSIFKGPNEEEVRRAKHIADMDALDAIERKRVRDENEERARIAELEGAAKGIADLDAEYEELKAKAKANRAERERLDIALNGDEADIVVTEGDEKKIVKKGKKKPAEQETA